MLCPDDSIEDPFQEYREDFEPEAPEEPQIPEDDEAIELLAKMQRARLALSGDRISKINISELQRQCDETKAFLNDMAPRLTKGIQQPHSSEATPSYLDPDADELDELFYRGSSDSLL
eukprot:CAMPEP_0118947376 /NCGR_PEP_ID=MMETSP1169-20130426/45890_1 /TAXON_ID=36882 /ORGANISM="Pyramimonas obovata, Strain CCMP722" /LENGTH=117 /DNA_ID=CAMNT_0006893575 /DNA_START=222 /DNA_END=572 /DNA_ORIENTATION=-